MMIYLALFCVSLLSVLGSEPPLSPGAREAQIQGGWDGCADMACIDVYEPVCGSNAKTYPNECLLTVAQCTDTAITLAHKGECTAVEPAREEAAKDTEPECDHSQHCGRDYRPVCGNDEKTYFSKCILERTRRESNPQLKVAYEGLCRRNHIPVHPHAEIPDHVPEECRVMCTMEYDPVCGTDGRTYGNKCELDSTACVQKSGVTVLKKGACETPQTPLRMKRSTCNERCPKMYKPVCGTDGKTYGNDCLFQLQKCRSGNSMGVAHKGEC